MLTEALPKDNFLSDKYVYVIYLIKYKKARATRRPG